MKIKTAVTFDDVLLIPQYSEISSRSTVSLKTDLGKGIVLDIPIVTAPMANICEVDMATEIARLGGLAIIHRFADTPDKQLYYYSTARNASFNVQNIGCAVGIQEHDRFQASKLVDYGCRVICIDVAHGDHKNTCEMVTFLAKKHPAVLIIAGNVATASGAQRLYEAGADVIRCGIGGGSLCTTRLETGNGVPQLTALDDVYQMSLYGDSIRRKYKIIADGGLRRAGDVVKSLCFSDAVMLGNILAGTDEAPGKTIVLPDGTRHKEYVGSSTHKNSYIEGVKAMVPCKGSVSYVLERLLEGVRSGFSYQGALNISQLQIDPEFVSVSSASLMESHPHDVVMR